MSHYAKAIAALTGALATWGVTAAEDGVYSQVELWSALLALATAVGVYAVPNKTEPDDWPRVSGDRGGVDPIAAAVLVVLLLVILYLVGLLPR